ncbi:CHASE2 domain-containing protein [Pseudomonadota bacterium]
MHRPHNGLSRHLFLAVVLLIITCASIYSDWLQRADLLVYDTHQRFWSRDAPDDVVIVAVDEYSLSHLGRWPWPRRIHADLINKLNDAGAKAIVLDIIFAEPDQHDPEGDALLAQAIHRHGGVILPVLFEQRYIEGQLIETLPLPNLVANAEGLGHAHVELDADGITRGAYLKEGLSDAYWPHLSLSLLTLLGSESSAHNANDLSSDDVYADPNMLLRDHYVMTPYAGPPGHFKHVSYARLMNEPELLTDLKGKIIFIGATATGLGDLLPTPVSALHHPMAGVEINANVFDAVRQGIIIEPATLEARLFMSLLIALLPVLFFPRLSPRNALFMSVALIVGTTLFSSLLLTQAFFWFPPSVPLLVLILAYPLWSWRRLEYANQFLSQELKRLHEEAELLPRQRQDVETVMAFVNNVMPINAWSLYQSSSCVAYWGERLVLPDDLSIQKHSAAYWFQLEPNKQKWWLGVSMVNGRVPSDDEQALITDVVKPYITALTITPASSIELFEERVLQVQQAERRIRAMRHFLDDSFNQMADGILVINNSGQLTFINAKALNYLGVDDDPQALREQPILPLLDAIEIEGVDPWHKLFSRALLDACPAQTNGRTLAGLDLLIQLNPLSLEQKHVNGIIINLSDISHIRASERQRLETFSFLSHDLRAPLASMLALVDVAKHNEIDEAFLNRVEMYANRTLNLAEDFLQISQLEHKVDLQFEVVDMGMIVANAIDAVWDLSVGKNIRIVDSLLEEPVYVKGDPGLLERALLNLLNNAVKYSGENTSINVMVSMDADSVCCRVQDSGFGIPEDALPNIFERYYRVNAPEHADAQGSGLGLCFVQSVVEKHGGLINVQSKAGEGSLFCVQLPLVRS